MLNICLKIYKRLNFLGCIYAAVATERHERMDILSGQKTESVNTNVEKLCICCFDIYVNDTNVKNFIKVDILN